MAINHTKHIMQRWVERIVGITEKLERDAYITNNVEQIKEHIDKTFNFSTFIYKGQIGDHITRHYYLKDDILFVSNTTNDALITVWKVDFGFTHELNLTVAKGLIREIHRLNNIKEEVEFQQLLEKEKLDDELAKIKEEEDILAKQLKILKEKKFSVMEATKKLTSNVEFANLEIYKFTNQLLNSKEYREDLKEGLK